MIVDRSPVSFLLKLKNTQKKNYHKMVMGDKVNLSELGLCGERREGGGVTCKSRG